MKKIFFNLLILLFIFKDLICIDNPHFYRASHFFEEPRIAKNCLTSIDAWGGGGKTSKGLNCNGMETNILNIYGDENIKFLAKNVPDCIFDKFQHTILNNLWTKETGSNFGKLKFSGKFNTIEIDFEYQQNFINGFFGEIYLPTRMLQIRHIAFDDLSNIHNAGPEIDFIEWRKFIANLQQNLAKVGLCYNRKFKHTGIGDLSILGGWTINYQETKHLDFIDATIKLGVLFPTGRQTNINNLFDLPQGYNGHYAIPLTLDMSAGLFDWLTFGVHGGALFFLDKTKKIRMKTDIEQNGFIKLTSGSARIDKGTLWTLGCFLKADHVSGGLSFLVAYRFDKENKTTLNPCDLKTFNPKIVNCDRMLNGWQMHTINVNVEYDFATLETPCMPRIGFFFDIPVGGKQIFKTLLSGGSIGIDYAW
jgi:hypothetical protein